MGRGRRDVHGGEADRQNRLSWRPVVAAAQLHGHRPGRRRGADGPVQQAFHLADPPPRLGPDQQVRPRASGRGKEVVEVGFAVGHRDDHLLGGQGGLGGGQGVEPALALFVGGLLLVPQGTLAQGFGVAGPGMLVERAQGDPRGADGQGRVQPEPRAFAVPEVTQPGGVGVVGEVEAGGVLDHQEWLMAVRLEAFQGDVAVRDADVLGVDAGVVPETVGGLGGGPIAGGDRHAGLRGVKQVVDQFDQAFIQALVPEVDVAEFEC